MTRAPGWEARLDAVVTPALTREFAWGDFDCASFALACAGAILGRDPGAAHRGTYHDALGATRIMARYGGLPGLATALLGTEPVPPQVARRGDVLLACRPAGPSLGVCNGAAGLFVAMRGLERVPLSGCEAAWHI